MLLLACGGVEQKRRTFPVEVAAVLPDGPNDFGWSVTLTSATARVESVRFYEGRVLVGRPFRLDPYALIGGTAWAHAGHYVPGQALGELLEARDVDLLAASPTELGLAQAVTGAYGSVELGLKSLRLTGTATKGPQTVTFDTTAYSPPKPVEGVKFDRLVQDEPGRVHVDVQLQTWISQVDFAAPFSADSASMNGFIRGARDTSAYEVTWR